MALTILSTPGEYYSIHGDLIFVAYEATKANDPLTYPDYRYVCDIYVGSVMVARLKAVPNPESKYGIFNIGSVVRNYVAALFKPTLAAAMTNYVTSWTQVSEQFYIDITVKFGEEYDFVLYTNVTVDSARRYFNHYNGRLIGSSTILSSYQKKILTRRPTTGKMYRSATYFFMPLLTNSNEFGDYFYRFRLLRANGSEMDNFGDNYIPVNINDQPVFNISPAAATDFKRLALSNPTLPVVTEETKYIEFSVENPLFSTPVYTFELICEPRYQVYALHFLNSLGGFDTTHFTKVSRKILDIDKQEFGKQPYTIDLSGVPRYFNSNNVYNETRSVYSSQYKEKLTLNTDILSDTEYVWLADLILSPMVFIEMEGYFFPCAITGSNYEFKKTINDKLTNLTINVEFGDQFNAQYR